MDQWRDDTRASTANGPNGPPIDDQRAAAVALARDAVVAVVAVVVVGTTEDVESEGFDRSSLALPGDQNALVREVIAANPRTVVVVNSGAPVLLPWADEAAAILAAWYPGQEFGDALADVLLGRSEPGGRLPTTWAAQMFLPSVQPDHGVLAYTESIHVGYRLWERSGATPAFPFGHGNVYTPWAYERIDCPTSVRPGDDAVVRITIRNTGGRDGREVVQVHASRDHSSVDPPRHWLAGFAIAEAGISETVTVDVVIASPSFAHWDVDAHDWRWEPGEFRLDAGRSLGDLRLVGTIAVANGA